MGKHKFFRLPHLKRVICDFTIKDYCVQTLGLQHTEIRGIIFLLLQTLHNCYTRSVATGRLPMVDQCIQYVPGGQTFSSDLVNLERAFGGFKMHKNCKKVALPQI